MAGPEKESPDVDAPDVDGQDQTPEFVAGYEAGWADQATAAEVLGLTRRAYRDARLFGLAADALMVAGAWFVGSLLAELVKPGSLGRAL